MKKYILPLLFVFSFLFSFSYPESELVQDTAFIEAQKLVKLEADSLNLLRIDSMDIFKPGRKTISMAPTRKDTIAEDTTGNQITETIISSAKDSIVPYFSKGKVHLYGEAQVQYGDLKIQAYHIEIDRKQNIVIASPKIDSTGVVGRPVFEQGSDKFYAKSIKYNFKTKKGYIKGVFTKQDEGFLHGERSKKHENGDIHIEGGKFTTCPYGHHPHFHMQLSRAIVQPNDKVVSESAYLMIAGMPTFVWVPFGVFPNSSSSKHGILFPSFGQDYRKGLYLKDMGYYFPISDYVDLAVKGSLYSRGSKDFEIQSRFRKNYAFSGDFRFQFLSNVEGTLGSLDYSQTDNYSITFNWNQDPKADPTSTISASVNYQSSDFDKNDISGSYNPNRYLRSNANSSVRYSKRWDFGNLSLSANASQNLNTKLVNLTLPSFNFKTKDWYLFKYGKQIGKPKWYEKIKTNLTLNGRNSISAHEDDVFNAGLNDYKNGMTYSLPLSSSVNFLKYFNFNYAFNVRGAIMTKKVNKTWHTREEREYGKDTLVVDTAHGIYNTFTVGPSLGLSFSPKVYFMYQFMKGLKINAIRHVMTPSISFNFTPNIGLDEDAYMGKVQRNRRGDVQEYGIYQGVNAYGAPSRSSDAQGSISFSLNNNIEMKVNDGFDKEGEAKTSKVALLKSLNFSSSYNPFADSLNFSSIRMNARTSVLGTSVNFGANFDPYATDSLGRIYNKFEYEENGILARPKSASLSFSLALDNKKMVNAISSIHSWITGKEEESNKEGDSENGSVENNEADLPSFGNASESQFWEEDEKGTDMKRPTTYLDELEEFSMPWSLNFSYSMNYRNRFVVARQEFVSEYKHYLNCSGKLTLTKNTNLNFRADYDFENHEIANFNVSLSRDMHCWQSSFNWVPFGNYRSFNFRMAIKSSMLADTFKYEADRRYNYNF